MANELPKMVVPALPVMGLLIVVVVAAVPVVAVVSKMPSFAPNASEPAETVLVEAEAPIPVANSGAKPPLPRFRV